MRATVVRRALAEEAAALAVTEAEALAAGAEVEAAWVTSAEVEVD